MPVLCRALAPSDAPAFQALRLRGLLESPSAFASSHVEEAATPLADVAERLAAVPGRAVFGAFDDDVLVGVVGLVREHHLKLAHKAFVWGMYVAPEARRQRTGAALLKHALAHAVTEWKVRQVKLGVNAANGTALALYRRLGFETFGLERDFLCVDGVFHDECQMAWRAGTNQPGRTPS
ncbi:MAG: GNAT family N-acetyltransferase [Burkholderiaceae bacterium]